MAFCQFWNVLLLFCGVMFSIRSFFIIQVYLRQAVWLFRQFCNVLLLFSGVMFSIRSFFTIAVYLR